jgi:hypothetical protein
MYINFRLENRHFWDRGGSVSVVPKLRDGPPVYGFQQWEELFSTASRLALGPTWLLTEEVRGVKRPGRRDDDSFTSRGVVKECLYAGTPPVTFM